VLCELAKLGSQHCTLYGEMLLHDLVPKFSFVATDAYDKISQNGVRAVSIHN
jgi:hypothetical protein